jgi:hypothetical protein
MFMRNPELNWKLKKSAEFYPKYFGIEAENYKIV